MDSSKSGPAPGSRSNLIQATGNSLMEGHGTRGVWGLLAQFLCCPQVQYLRNTWYREYLSTLATELYDNPGRSAFYLILPLPFYLYCEYS